MGSEVLLAIGGVVGALARFLVSVGVRGVWATVATVVVAAGTLAIWGYDAGDFRRDTTWEYFTAFVEMLLVSAGAFHLVEEGQKAQERRRDV